MELVLVTGAAGYIGSILTPMLLNEGYGVIAVDTFRYGQLSLLDCCHHPNLEIIRVDARDESFIKRTIGKADWIFPLACLTGAPICDQFPEEATEVNLDAIISLIALRNRNQRIIFPTTNSMYGDGQGAIHCDETTRLKPLSHYARLKVNAEQCVLESENALTLRLATVFGISPRMRLDLLVNDFVNQAVKKRSLTLFEPHFKRNYIHVRDVARAFLHCMRNFSAMKGQPYNVGLSSANLSKRKLAEEIKVRIPDLTINEDVTGTDPDKRNYIVSNARIEATGFQPHISLQRGIAELIKGFQVIPDEVQTLTKLKNI